MKLLVLLSRFPYPLEKGDKLRAYNHIKYLSKNNEIILCAINTKKLDKNALISLETYCKTIEIINLSRFNIFLNLLKGLFTKRPFQVEFFYSKKAQKRIDSLIQRIKPDHILCQLIRVSEYVKNSGIPKTLDYQDVFSKGIERRISLSPFYVKWFLKIELNRLLKYENYIFGYFENKIIISNPDKNFIPHAEKGRIVVIPNGVDIDYYKIVDSSSLIVDSNSRITNNEQPTKKYDLLFTGNMGYYPNVIAAIYLVREILPKLMKFKPDLKLLIAGANPDRKIRALKSDNVSVSGWVEDMRVCYSESRIFIAPMLIGTGLQNKLLEAMAMKLACITSKLANDALEAENENELFVCNTTEEYVKSIMELLNNKTRYETISNNGYNFVAKKYNWAQLTGKLETVIRQSSVISNQVITENC